MALQFVNKKEVINYLALMSKRIEAALIYNLEYMVAELENHAKLNAGYTDQTSNLKGSIGGVILKNGKPVSYAGFDTGGEVGSRTGMEFLNSLISQNTKGYVILVVAGMEYATYVENYYNLNVLKQTELKMARELPQVLENLKNKIK